MNHLDPESLKIPAYLRNKAIVRQSKQKLILTALDRKEAKLSVHSKQALAEIPKSKAKSKSRLSKTPRVQHQIQAVPTNRPISRFAAINEAAERQKTQHTTEITQPTEQFESSHTFKLIGETTHYLEKINVAIILLTQKLKIGDKILIQTENGLSIQTVDEMQIDRKNVRTAAKGSHIGMKVTCEALLNGKVYKFS